MYPQITKNDLEWSHSRWQTSIPTTLAASLNGLDDGFLNSRVPLASSSMQNVVVDIVLIVCCRSFWPTRNCCARKMSNMIGVTSVLLLSLGEKANMLVLTAFSHAMLVRLFWTMF